MNRTMLTLTTLALVLTGGAVVQVLWDLAELQQVQAADADVVAALASDDLTPIGAVLVDVEGLDNRLRTPVARRALANRLQGHWQEVAFLLHSAVPLDQATLFIEERQYARARQLAETVRWLVENIPLQSNDRLAFDRDANLRYFEEIEGHILLRQFRATLDNRSLISLTEQLRDSYPSLYANNLEVFLNRAEQKYRNGIALEASGDREGARQSYAVATHLVPTNDQYAQSLALVEQALNPAENGAAPLP
ncbi:MAG: hypothetical protein HC926_03745 [Synechococcaceae cyanobacterium SM2_3_60]|nr:hypothetical protein [Synechococcaceae cyanobacterium SM2_3_60]